MKKPPTTGRISKALEDALLLRKGLIADGTPEAEADYIVGQGLKGTLGSQREWKFYCEHCRDTSWITVEPSPEELQRLTKLYGEHPQYQGNVVKCEPCKWTQMEREKRRKQLGQDMGEDDLAAAGQTKSKRKFSRFGA